MTFWLWCAVAVVGGGGAIARFLLDATISRRFGRLFPLGTLVVNLTGAFVLGLLSGAGLAPDALLVAGTATIGSYTTFSTWMLESQRLAEDGDARGAAVNLLASIAVGVAAAALGRTIGVHL
ncbi:MAG TPA: fluoride efflux transporter CrcB [Solirubrobacteraceae bacterium]|jgi:CrcB protein